MNHINIERLASSFDFSPLDGRVILSSLAYPPKNSKCDFIPNAVMLNNAITLFS